MALHSSGSNHQAWISPRQFASSGLSKFLICLAFSIFCALCSAAPASALAVVSLSTTPNCDAVTGMNISGVSLGGAIVTDAAGITIWAGVGDGQRPFAPFEGPTDNSQWTVTDHGTGAFISFTPSTFASQCAPASLTVTAGDVNASAPQGGSVTPLSTTYTLTNAGGSAIYPLTTPYFAAGTVFFNLSAVPATIGPFSSVNVTVTFNTSASSQSLGAHSATIAFANAAKLSVVTTRTVNLTITAVQPPTLQLNTSTAIISTGNQGGPFTPSSFTYQLSAPTGPVNYSISGLPAWLNVSTTFGTVAINSATVVTFAILPSAIGLPPGTYNASIAFTNTTNGLGNQSVAATLTVIPTSPPPVQTNRTWVSGLGSDANDCSRTAPCLTFAGAFAKTLAGGEINALDSGGFGTLTITKSITIRSDHVEAGIRAAGTTAITVNVGANDVVELNDLDIEGAGFGLNGVEIVGGGSITIRRCSIRNFTQNGVNLTGTASARVFVVDSLIRSNSGGLNVQGAAGAANVGLLVRTMLDQNSAFAAQVTAPSRLILSESKLLGSAIGISNPGGNATVTSFGDNAIGGTGSPTVLNAPK